MIPGGLGSRTTPVVELAKAAGEVLARPDGPRVARIIAGTRTSAARGEYSQLTRNLRLLDSAVAMLKRPPGSTGLPRRHGVRPRMAEPRTAASPSLSAVVRGGRVSSRISRASVSAHCTKSVTECQSASRQHLRPSSGSARLGGGACFRGAVKPLKTYFYFSAKTSRWCSRYVAVREGKANSAQRSVLAISAVSHTDRWQFSMSELDRKRHH